MNRIPFSSSAPFRAVTAVAVLALASGTAGAQPKQGGTLTIALGQDPALIDPLAMSTWIDRGFAQPIYEALFEIDPSGKPVPFLAESYTTSEDGKTWRVKLRQGVKFHDGTPLDAAAAVANLERTRNPANRCRCLSLLTEFKEVKAVDPATIEIVLTQPNYALPTILADAPGTMVSPTAFKADPQAVGLKPVGTGPFRFVEWIRNSRFVAERNPDYWQKGKPYLDRVILRGMQNTETREAAYKAGQVDVLVQPSKYFASTASSDKRSVLHKPAGFGTEGVYMNVRKPPLDDIRIRRAVVHAIDRDLINRTLNFGLATPAYSPFGAGMAGVKQPVAEYPKYDPAEARKLVSAYGKPVAFTLQHMNSPPERHMAQSIQEMLAKAGMKVELQALDVNRALQNMQTREWEASLFRFTGRADPHINSFVFFHSKLADRIPSSNWGSWTAPGLDALLERGMADADPAKRAEVYSEFGRVLVKDLLPVAYLTNVTDYVVVRATVKGVQVPPDGILRTTNLWKQ